MEWRNIENYDGYKVYENGDVYCRDEKVEPFINKRNKKWYVSIRNNSDHKACNMVARLVYTSFKTNIKDGTLLVYKDGNYNNCYLSNLKVINKYKKVNGNKPIKLDKNKKWIPVYGYEKFYKISDYGDIYSVHYNRLLKQIKKDGYTRVTLNKNKEQKKFYVHRLVYESYHKHKLKQEVLIDHINRNRSDNYIKNLRIASRSENAKNCIKKSIKSYEILQYTTDGKFIKKWESYKKIINDTNFKRNNILNNCYNKTRHAYGYVWRYINYVYDQTDFTSINTYDEFNFSRYKINKKGTVININGRIVQHIICGGYYQIGLTADCGKFKSNKIHRLVGMTFIENPDKYNIINHIDENKLNNNVSNLEWCTLKQNSNHSLAKKVKQIDPKTNKIISVFNSIADASESLGKPRKSGNITAACKGRQSTAFGYKWKYV